MFVTMMLKSESLNTPFVVLLVQCLKGHFTHSRLLYDVFWRLQVFSHLIVCLSATAFT